jgi:NAD(P)-dependent dehydrogenase (short-subunit alcohol dehydrogenase family)
MPISRVPLKETREGVRNWWSVMNLGIDGKTALVTAASKGLGRACALALAAEGVNVVICARGSDALESTAREITSAGGTAYAVVADVTDASAPDYLVQATIGRFGGIDILVGNSGGPPAMRAQRQPPGDGASSHGDCPAHGGRPVGPDLPDHIVCGKRADSRACA